MPTAETTANELTSPGRRSDADHANGSMTTWDQSREGISSSIADLLMPIWWTRVGFLHVRALFKCGWLAQTLREVNNYNLAIMGITEARWAGARKQRLNSGEIIIWSGDRTIATRRESHSSLPASTTTPCCSGNPLVRDYST